MSFTTATPVLIQTRSFPQDPNELQPVLTKMYTEVASIVNSKTNGLYESVAITTGNRYFADGDATQSKKQSFRKVFSFAAINAGANLQIAHKITGITQVVQIYGTCITVGAVNPNGVYLPIPYASTANINRQIQLDMNNTNITITNGAGADNISSGTIVVEYLLN